MTTIAKCLLVSLIVGSSSCMQDHKIPGDGNTSLPEAHCLLIDGKPRPYECEFVIEKLVFLNKDGTTMAEVSAAKPTFALSLSKAKSSVIGNGGGALTVAVKAIVKRVANPSFTPSAGYVLRYTTVTTPFESDKPVNVIGIGNSIQIPIPIGSTQEISFDLVYPFQGMMFNSVPRFFGIENDVTTTKFGDIQTITIPLKNRAEAFIDDMKPILIN